MAEYAIVKSGASEGRLSVFGVAMYVWEDKVWT